MVQRGQVTGLLATRRSRRALLASSFVGMLGLVACGDDSNTRQFAGGPLTPENDQTPLASEAAGVAGSPTALPTQLPVRDLLSPRDVVSTALIAFEHRLTAFDLETGVATELWIEPKRRLWSAALSTNGERVALLSAPAGAATGWIVDFVAVGGSPLANVVLGHRRETPEPRPDAVAAGEGGITWIGETDSAAVSVPSGGILQVFTDGSQVGILAASDAKRPAAVAVSRDAGRIAYVDQPSGSEGSGVFAGSMRAKPIDPIVVMPADRSGNRYAHDLGWIGSSGRVATVIEREELGDPQGDLFYLDTSTGLPTLAWTSPAGRESWSVMSFTVSDDGAVVAFLTNPSNPGSQKPSSVWVLQVDGSALERFELPVQIIASRLVFSRDGIAISGIVSGDTDVPPLGAVYVVSPAGEVIERYRETIPATPVASPVGSPVASPAGTPVASPSADLTTNGSPSPVTKE